MDAFLADCNAFVILSHQDKLTYFRIKELKDVLSQLGLAKHGKKQVSQFFLLYVCLQQSYFNPNDRIAAIAIWSLLK